MTQFNHGLFVRTLRQERGSIPADWYADIMKALEAGLHGTEPETRSDEPAWLVEARKHMGLREVRGRKHNPTILGWIKKLGGWFTDDETPWCGTFTAFCMQAAGKTYPKHWYRALAWADWGQACGPVVGAVAVFHRKGGGHVGFVVGESRDNFYILGGNQSNAVNIMPLAKSRLVSFRWPADSPIRNNPLPAMSGGIVSRNEA